jgi:hypothetical protein
MTLGSKRPFIHSSPALIALRTVGMAILELDSVRLGVDDSAETAAGGNGKLCIELYGLADGDPDRAHRPLRFQALGQVGASELDPLNERARAGVRGFNYHKIILAAT